MEDTKTMKKISALIMLVLFIVSLAPTAFAQDAVTTDATDVSDETKVDDSTEVGDSEDDDKDELTKRQKLNRRTVSNVQDKMQERNPEATRKDARRHLANNPGKARKAVRATAKDIRTNRMDHLRAAKEKCAESDDPSRCEEALNERLDRLENLSEEDLERAKLAERKMGQRYKEWKTNHDKPHFKKFKGDLLEARKISKDRIENARDRYKKAHDRYQNAREKYRNARDKFGEVKERVKECKDDDSEECENVRAEAKESAIAQLQRAMESVVSQLEKIKERVESNDALSDDEANTMLDRINAKLDEAESLQAKVDSLTVESSYEDIKALSKEVRGLLKGLHTSVKKHAGKEVNARVGQAIAKSQKLTTRLDNALVKLAEKGKDISTVEPLVDEFNELLSTASRHYESAQDKYSSDDVEGAHQDMRAAHSALKDAHSKLKEVVRAIHALGGERDLSDSLSDDEAVEAEAEDAADDSSAEEAE